MGEEKRLPYDFDLIYDVKWMWEVESIVKGEASHSDASPEDLARMFIELEMDLPDCLRGVSIIPTPKEQLSKIAHKIKNLKEKTSGHPELWDTDGIVFLIQELNKELTDV